MYSLIFILNILLTVHSVPITNIKQSMDNIVYPTESKIQFENTHQTSTTVKNHIRRSICEELHLNSTKKFAADLDNTEISCHEVGTKGPCNVNMKFYSIPGKPELGMCDCDHGIRGLAYSRKSKLCHFLFQQGYCVTGEWLILNEGKLECLFNNCDVNITDSSNNSTNEGEVLNYSVIYNNGCARLYDECKTEDFVGRIGFDSSNVLTCLPIDTNYSLSSTIQVLQCAEGTRWSNMTNSCKKSIKFKFS